MNTGKRDLAGGLAAALLIVLLGPWPSAQAAEAWDRVIFHVDDAERARRALMLARSYLDDVPGARVVFVAYGRGVDFLREDATDRHEDPYDYAVLGLANRGVGFHVCAATLEGRRIPQSDLLDVVKIVPSGISEIARLQTAEGYAYLKP